MHDVTIENISDIETIECIKVFDEEMILLLSRTPDLIDIEIEKYTRKAGDGEKMPAEIHMEISREGKHDHLVFKEDYFEDYCYSNRKERNTLLNNILTQMKSRLEK